MLLIPLKVHSRKGKHRDKPVTVNCGDELTRVSARGEELAEAGRGHLSLFGSRSHNVDCGSRKQCLGHRKHPQILHRV